MGWRVALIDSCGTAASGLVIDGAAFDDIDGIVHRVAPVADPTGHGHAVLRILLREPVAAEFVLAQVFVRPGPTTAATVAHALDWAVDRECNLVHMSLGLAADRPPLARSVRRALEKGCVVVGSAPARGATMYPAGYPGVIGGTGDARCAAGEWSVLSSRLFGGHPRGADVDPRPNGLGGASAGAAWLTSAIISMPVGSPEDIVAALHRDATYRGRERRGSGDLPDTPTG